MYQYTSSKQPKKQPLFSEPHWLGQVLHNAHKAQQSGDHRRANKLLLQVLPAIVRLHAKGNMV